MCVLCAHHCAQLSYTTQHRTVLIISPSYPPDNHHCSDDVYWRGGASSLLWVFSWLPNEAKAFFGFLSLFVTQQERHLASEHLYYLWSKVPSWNKCPTTKSTERNQTWIGIALKIKTNQNTRLIDWVMVFTARRSYASAVLGVVILSVCLSITSVLCD